MKRNKALRISIGVLAVSVAFAGVLAFSGCNKKQEKAAPKPKVAKEVTPEPAPEPEPQFFSRLTGLPVKESTTKRRPIALMIENTKACQPHYGINKAGIIYECPVEGGITREMGIFENYSGLKRFGNVRSCRPYYVYIAKEFDAVYVHFGQSTQGKALLATGIVDDLNGLDGSISSSVFYRTSDKAAPHNAYTSTQGIKKGMKMKGFATKIKKDTPDHFHFASEEYTPEGKDAQVICPYFFDNKPYFIYDSSSGKYSRYEFGAPEKDAVDNKQVKVKNIIFQNVVSSTYEGGLKLNIPLNGKGKGTYFTKGKMVPITWKKDSDGAVTKYYTEDGKELEVNPGRTWVCLIQESQAAKNRVFATVKESGY
ncbi:MAG: DUF3048 domain-containing protein [Candidatus Weimeria sp.]|nr:DUF3048 domain-containing protein [Lachnospiraceae bacterium]MEE3354728.1 DUF3048 domain-containing protein [Candidatus Weimeria sp.]